MKHLKMFENFDSTDSIEKLEADLRQQGVSDLKNHRMSFDTRKRYKSLPHISYFGYNGRWYVNNVADVGEVFFTQEEAEKASGIKFNSYLDALYSRQYDNGRKYIEF